MRWIECGVLAALIAGCGRWDYDPLGADETPRVVGSAICGDGASAIEVGDRVLPGSVVLVQVMVRGDGGDASVLDSRLNGYELLAAPGGDQLRLSVFASQMQNGLDPGDTIEATHPAGTAASVIAVVFGGVVGQPGTVVEGGAGDTSIDVPFSQPATGLSYCAVAVRNASFEIDAPWIERNHTESVCDNGAPFTANNAGYWIPAGSDATGCTGAITGGANGWQAVVATYAELPDGAAAPARAAASGSRPLRRPRAVRVRSRTRR